MASVYTSYFQTPYHLPGSNVYIDVGQLVADGGGSSLTQAFPMNTIMYASAKQEDAADANIECDLATAQTVIFTNPTASKTYQCLIIGKM